MGGDNTVSNNYSNSSFSNSSFSTTSLMREKSGKLTYTGIKKNQIHGLFSAKTDGNLIYNYNGEFNTKNDVVFDTVKINNYPTDISNVATVGYVNNMIQRLDIKNSVKCATTSNIDLSGSLTIDGVITSSDNRVLVKDQNNAKNNGIYIVNSNGDWNRSLDFDDSVEVQGAFVFV